MATTPKPPTPAPKVVPIPAGWRRALASEITPAVQGFARKALSQAQPIGKLQSAEVEGKVFGALTEWHYDDHVTKPGNYIWHPGISIIVPVKPIPKAVALATAPTIKKGTRNVKTGQLVTDDPFTRGTTDIQDLIEGVDKRLA